MKKSQCLTADCLRSHGSFLARPLFLMAPYKAGSTMLFVYTRSICRLLNVSYVDYPQHIWEKGGDLVQEYYANPSAHGMLSEPLVYIGNRQAVTTLSEDTHGKIASLMMIRDPRDALVSMYFSFLHSHAKPLISKRKSFRKSADQIKDAKQSSLPDIDNYVLENAEWYKQLMNNVLGFGKKAHSVAIIRYEDYVRDKNGLCSYLYKILESSRTAINEKSDRPHKITGSYIPTCLHPFLLRLIAKSQDKIPSVENPQSHVRKAIPGDHSNKLAKSTIVRLNCLYSEILETWYPENASS
jgi:hypothetical protein